MNNILRRILNIHYGLKKLSLTRLEGYANQNYLVKTLDGQKFVLKVHTYTEEWEDFITAEAEILLGLKDHFSFHFPVPVFTNSGQPFVTDNSFPGNLIRLFSWVEGDFFYQVKHTPEMSAQFGRMMAELDQHLSGENGALIRSRKIEWDLQHLLDFEYDRSLIQDTELRKKVHYFLLQFREKVLPELAGLRKSIIHNDANDWNILVSEGEITGLIDFGDMVYAPLIQEVAVALPYIMFDKENPLSFAKGFIAGYHSVLPLEKKELDLLYYLVAGRICMSILMAARSSRKQPENEYLGVSQSQMNDLLDRWLEINPAHASDVFDMACGYPQENVKAVSELLDKRSAFISNAQSVSYRRPIHMTRAAFQYMYDAEGNAFLDAYNNIPHVGHQHPVVVEAGQRQMAVLNTNTRYLYDQLAAYAEKLLSMFPAPLNKVFFVNSGSAASDLAIRIAQTVTRHRNVMVLEHGYHGNTRLGIRISHYKFGRKGGKGKEDNILLAPIPDTFRGPWTDNDGSAGKAYAQEAIRLLNSSNEKVAAFIAEPIVGCAGQVPLAKDYLKNLYPEIRKQGGLCISDEVQTGFGRMGSTFWGYELQEVIPDLVVLGKPMGNGHPIGAVVTTTQIAEAFDNGMEFFSSFGGNPVSCAIGSAVLDVIEEEQLQQNALKTGNYFLQSLNELKQNFEYIGDVRGEGLFVGIELVRDKKTKEVHTEFADKLKNQLRENFILVGTDGPYDNIIKMKPPLCFNRQNVDRVVEMMDLTLRGF